ncbi:MULTISPECIES: glycosyltransferase [unclassified Janthinobacterium]|uniref:glycosyltransferase n=1 Tax=unclassified Janthinobacterium TaxID=2610881 RepID=UPI0018DEE1CC|nr:MULTISPECIES: glycosyltransferase [unclassified Janthinobacterium]
MHLGKYYPPDSGGIESVTETLVEGTYAHGYASTVICFDKGKLGSTRCKGGEVVRLPIDKMLNAQPLGWAYLWRGIRAARKADIVHVHTPNLLASLATLFIGSKPKLLVHWHSDIVGKGMMGHVVRPLENLMLRRADVVLATSQRYADGSAALRRFAGKVSVVPLGVPEPRTEAPPQPLSERLNLFIGGRRLVLSVGRLTAYKGFSVLVEAARSLPSDVAVVIAGGGELMPALARQIAERGLGQRILLAGRVSDQELRALYLDAQVFCLPSIHRSEAFGVVLLEAMAYGVPIVATDIAGSGVPWVNADGVSGLNAASGSPAALARACCQILASPELRTRLANGARNRYERHFTDKSFAQEVANIYTKML